MGDDEAALVGQAAVESGEDADPGADENVGQGLAAGSGKVVGVNVSLFHNVWVFGVPFFIGHDIEIAPVVFTDIVAQVPSGPREIEVAGRSVGAAIGGSIIAFKDTAVDVFPDPFAGGLGLPDAFFGQIPGGAVSFAKFGGEIAGIAPFGRFDGDVAFGLPVPDKNEFKGAVVIQRLGHMVTGVSKLYTNLVLG